MGHGFEKLERLFTGSRRKGREKKDTGQWRKASLATSPRPSSPAFPSPPYLRPTSTHMTPRNAQIKGPEADKDRSDSAPTLQEALHKRSSVASSITVVDRSSRSDASTSSIQHGTRNSQNASRQSRFRFPEDALFKNDRPTRCSRDSGSIFSLREQSRRSHVAEPRGLLDWSPKHISLLFNPLEFEASSNDPTWVPGDTDPEPTLLPSPDFAPSALLPTSHEVVYQPVGSTFVHPSPFSHSSVHKFTSNSRENSLFPRRETLGNFSTTFGNHEGKCKPTIQRSMSLNATTLSYPGIPHRTSICLPSMRATSKFRGRRSARETWGNRLEDPHFSVPPMNNSEGISQLKLRRSASTSTLSILASKTPKDRILKEPTFDDFYALSDDDIAESRPLTPDSLTPPPPKSVHGTYRRSRLPPALTSQHIAFKPTQESITPPATPPNCRLLALTYSPTNYRDTLGAFWAAVIAKKYDFAVLYVLSLWPGPSDCYLDTSANISASEPGNVTMSKGFGAVAKGPRVSGRLLAAYGLNEVPSPFKIVTDTHLAALNCDQWNEYRNVDACPNDISRGWIRPFYSDYAPASASSSATRSLSDGHPKNRGIVFAAYSKQTSSPLIPMGASLEQKLILQHLYSDAKALVEALTKRLS
ncbi:hypothetical protein NUW58_g9613 [Xylaria curta]|uniref:Uncharacterized protein n=1 Tax=Xylaria curta TaxID=42375 RepID=A0ACC1MWV2_9PEZI|nr:hypothetical protein NUW58_g9613 [Xylaria curta]